MEDAKENMTKLEKLKNSLPVVVEKDDYEGEYELTADAAQKWILANLRGQYIIEDTDDLVELTRIGAKEVTSHSRNEVAHLKSISVIPQMLRKAIYIEERDNSKNSGKYDKYRYYVVGVIIDGIDFTAKIVIGVKQGMKYYDHRLTRLEKTKLVDYVNQPVSDFTTAGNASLPPYIESKDKTLFDILKMPAKKNSVLDNTTDTGETQ